MKNRTPVRRGTNVLFSYVRWSADELEFIDSLAASKSEMYFNWSIKADIHFGLIVPRRMPAFIVIQFICVQGCVGLGQSQKGGYSKLYHPITHPGSIESHESKQWRCGLLKGLIDVSR